MNELQQKLNEINSYIKNKISFPQNYLEKNKDIFCLASYGGSEFIEDLIKKIKNELNNSYLDEFVKLINYKSKDGKTPLYYSVNNGNKKFVNLLCDNGANPTILSNEGISPLELARKKLSDYTEIVKKLELTINKYNFNNSVKKNLYIKKNIIKKDKNDIFFKSITPKGLKNINGSCSINSTLQCLFHVKSLSYYFLNEKEKLTENSLSNSYYVLVSGLVKNNQNNSMLSHLSFKKELEKQNPNYKKYGCDSKDIIMDFFYYINKEILGDECSMQLNNKINKCNKKILFEYYKEEFQRTKTIITELFGWFKQTRRYCRFCKKNTFDFIFELYFNFSLQKICTNTCNKRKLKLLECFKFYFKQEKKKFTCQNSNCRKENINGDIDNKLCVLPEYLIIILDRGKDDKFDCHVEFDYDLDLKEVTEQIEDIKYNTRYGLIGATFLYGSSGAGHTVAFCKHFDNKYYLFDDSTYSEKKLEDLKNNKAFLLFYERKNN